MSPGWELEGFYDDPFLDAIYAEFAKIAEHLFGDLLKNDPDKIQHLYLSGWVEERMDSIFTNAQVAEFAREIEEGDSA
jgi:hypothetical protein